MSDSNLIERTHHEFSPSRLPVYASCPYAWKNCQNWMNQAGENAKRGRLLHESVYDDSIFNALPDKEKDMIRHIRDEHVIPYKDMIHFMEMLIEVHDPETGELITFGYLDDLVISPDGTKANLKDYKFGNIAVTEAEHNMQIKAYVIGIFQQNPNVTSVFAMIVQPIYGDSDYDKQFEFTRDMLPELLNELKQTIANCRSAVPDDANPSPENCKYCNKLNCPAYIQRMTDNLKAFSLERENIPIDELPMTVEYADRVLMAEKEICAIMKDKTDAAKALIVANGGSENFRTQTRVTKKTDWKSIASELPIPQEIIDAHTTETVSEPFLATRMRKSKKKEPEE